MLPPSTSTQLASIRRFVGDRHGKTLIGYSSFMLLLAIAAIAVLTQVRAGTTAPHATAIDLSN
jgi:Flp pilus assembly pilin Flp